jgi:hypothetical protein
MIFVKKYKKFENQFGLSAVETYDLELTCLKRLQGHPNVCQLIGYDRDKLTLDLKFCGHSYEKPRGRCTTLPLSKLQFIKQWQTAIDQLALNNVVHVDLLTKNICLHLGYLTIIDFGIAVIDGKPKSKFIEKRYNDFIANGGYEYQKYGRLKTIFEMYNAAGIRWP